MVKRGITSCCLIGIGLMALVALPSAVKGQGTLYIVDSIGDGSNVAPSNLCDDGTGHCTLRAAIEGSNLNPGADRIEILLPAGAVINLTHALPDIVESVSIAGLGANRLTVRRAIGGNYRIFNVTAIDGTVSFSGMTISNGFVSSIFESGGGIQSTNLITINLTNCAVSGNQAVGDGGGIFNNSGNGLNINNCTISGNTAGGDGAGVNSQGGQTNIINSTLTGNAAGGDGGAIFNTFQSMLNVSNSTLSGNSCFGSGGGIFNVGPAHVKSSIIALNTAAVFGQDLSNETGAGTAVFTSHGFNLIGKNGGVETSFPAGSPNANNDMVGGDFSPVDPKLSPEGLQDNGGLTETIALLPQSRAIDRGTSFGLTGSLTNDQRGPGFARTFDYLAISNFGGDGTDIGAFEFRGIAPPIVDFNRDGFTDYLLVSPSTRRTAIWNLMENLFVTGVYGPSLPAGWTLVCAADMNLDSKQDYVLFEASTRRTAVWFLNNATFLSSAFGPTLPAGWSLIAAVDINHDAHPDYVLFNASTRQTAVWFLNNTSFIGGAFGPTLPAGWVLIDAIDFDANGNPDFLLAEPSTGRTGIWYLSLTSRISSLFGPTLPSGWMLKGSADFNGDGQPDYLLFEPSTRRTAQWYLNSANLRIGAAYSPTLPAGYTLAAP